AVSAGQTQRAHSLFIRWLAVTVAAGAAGVAIFTLWRHELSALLLGEAFRHGADLLPWIAAGYALKVLADVFTRVCFAHGETGVVFALVLWGSIAGLGATVVATRHWGLAGAAFAVPVYFTVQLGAAMLAARVSHKRAVEPGRVQWPA